MSLDLRHLLGEQRSLRIHIAEVMSLKNFVVHMNYILGLRVNSTLIISNGIFLLSFSDRKKYVYLKYWLVQSQLIIIMIGHLALTQSQYLAPFLFII